MLAELKTIVNANNFVILDTETTGLHEGEIVEIAIIDHNSNVLVNRLLKPAGGIPESASAIHGITDDDVANAMLFKDALPEIRGAVAGKDVLVYNAKYDRRMLHQTAEMHGVERTDWKGISNWFCVMEAYAHFYGDWSEWHQSYKWKPLGFAYSQFGGTQLTAHRALSDCLMTYKVVRGMVDTMEMKSAVKSRKEKGE